MNFHLVRGVVGGLRIPNTRKQSVNEEPNEHWMMVVMGGSVSLGQRPIKGVEVGRAEVRAWIRK
jgi:hypothetical protein